MPPRTSKGLDSLARLYGIESVFTDELGRRQTVSVDNLRNVLTLLGAPDGSPSHIRDATERASLSTWLTVLPATMVVQQHALPRVWHIYLPLGKRALSDMRVAWSIDYESREKAAHYALSGPRADASKTIEADHMCGWHSPFRKIYLLATIVYTSMCASAIDTGNNPRD